MVKRKFAAREENVRLVKGAVGAQTGSSRVDGASREKSRWRRKGFRPKDANHFPERIEARGWRGGDWDEFYRWPRISQSAGRPKT